MKDEKENEHSMIKKGEIQLNYKAILLFCALLVLGWLLGDLQGYIWSLKLNRIGSIMLSVIGFSVLIFMLRNRQNKNITNPVGIIILFIASTIYFINIFYPLFK